MSFDLNLNINIPGTSTGKVATTLRNAVVNHLNEEADGLTSKQAAQLAIRGFLKGLYTKEVQRVDVAIATSADRADIDAARALIEVKEVDIKVTERGIRSQAGADFEEA